VESTEIDVDGVAALGHLNLLEQSRQSTRWGVGGSLDEEDGVLLFATGSWLPVMCNGAFRSDDLADPTMLIERAEAYFRPRKRGYTVMIRDLPVDDDLQRACASQGLRAFGDPSPEMVCFAPPNGDVPDGIELRRVETADAVADFAAVSGDAYGTYGMPADVPSEVFSAPERFLAAPDVHAVVAYAGTVPVAAALVLVSHGIAGVYWVGTVGSARGRGLGRCVTASVTNAAFERGAGAVTLQASVMGEPIYRTMGFIETYRYTNWVRFAVPDS
jgi:ribosomal protein S18 acetylase RimI-like enzyme